MRRVFIIVLDSFGIGQAPDASRFGDEGADTLCALTRSKELQIPNLIKAGLGCIDGVTSIQRTDNPTWAYGRMQEASAGKDTTVGHWEIAGLVSHEPLPTFPNGFPREVLDAFSKATGRGVLCNKPYSGTEVIRDYGPEHIRTGSYIVYTSADSVFQIAAHKAVVPLDVLYEDCEKARKILTGPFGVGRVIARPFEGAPGAFVRTSERRDFSVEPFGETMLDKVKKAGLDVISVGKIYDIFAGRSITEFHLTHGNREGMETALKVAQNAFSGLCFINLVDFDMLYGHRRDVDGYARALSEFDSWLPRMTALMQEDDVLILTADHGCDPSFIKTTDHTREYVPMLAFGKKIRPVNLGTRRTFADIASTVTDWLDTEKTKDGTSMADAMT